MVKKNMDKKQDHLYAAYKRLTSDLKTPRLKVSGWKKVFNANGNVKNNRQNRLENKYCYKRQRSA